MATNFKLFKNFASDEECTVLSDWTENQSKLGTLNDGVMWVI